MSVVSSHLIRNGRSGRADARARREFDVRWRVTTNDENDGPLAVMAFGPLAEPHPIPVRYQIYNVGNEFDTTSVCLDVDVTLESDGSEKKWIVDAHYGPPERNQPGDDLPPLERPVRYRIETANYTRPLEKDIHGAAIVNAIARAFDPPPEQDEENPVIVATKNYASLGEMVFVMRHFRNAVNSDLFYGANPWQARIVRLAAQDQVTEQDQTFWQLSIGIEFCDEEEDFRRHFLNQGMGYYDNAQDKNIQTRLPTGKPILEPVLLAADGTLLPAGQEETYITRETRRPRVFGLLQV